MGIWKKKKGGGERERERERNRKKKNQPGRERVKITPQVRESYLL